ncbi:MAG: hypothetical protein K6C14_07055 [Eubacterium sp.]|nr:hypothetical protein [Eubacterium sp.]
MKDFILSKKGKTAVIAGGALTALISGIMNFVLIPKIEASAGIRCFDMNFAYGFDDASAFLSNISDEARALYLNVQLPLDFIYPIAYCLFFTFLIIRLCKRVNALVIFPVTLAAFDYAENICSIMLLKSSELSARLVSFGSTFTTIKTLLMYSTFIVIIICIIFWFKKRKKEAD